MTFWALPVAALLLLGSPALADPRPASAERAAAAAPGFYDTVRQRLRIVRTRLAAQREGTQAVRARMQGCRAQAEQPRPAGGRLVQYRDCLGRG